MSASDDRDPVDLLAEDFADRLRRGEFPSVSDYASMHPEHADQLRDLLPAVAQMEQLKRFRRSTTPVNEAMPSRFGDFRIVRELGRGGMGVVFEAVQESLDRRVALKVLARHAQLDRDKRARFVREAHAAARLHHSNIVPVFGVGEQDGLPYYVMQLIPGHGLHTIIANWHGIQPARPTASTLSPRNAANTPAGSDIVRPPALIGGPKFGDWEFVARIGIQAAEALDYAHGQGVLHRDVKPGNLLLEDGERVWVADFGLAKIVDLNGLTATGDILGTLQYLAPECLTGESSPRSDVYGLGATLYEMLTGEPPFAADSPARLIKLIGDTEPLPPRALNADIPRDLETIVLKAMAREPAARYRTARLLAEDLRAFLEDRPIRARRTSMVGRAWRWCRRNRAVAALSLVTVVALTLAAVVGWGGYVQTRAALAAEAKRRTEAEQASAKLGANLQLSLEAFEKVFEAAGGGEMRPPFGPRGPGGPGGGFGFGPKEDDAANRAAVLEAVLAFYDRFAEQNATNPQLRFEAGKAHRRVGEMHQWLGRDARASAAFRRATDLLDPLQHDFPAEEKYRVELMIALAHAPLDDASPKGLAAAERELSRAAELGRELPRRWPAGVVDLKLAWVREQAGDKAAAARTYQDAIGAFTASRDRPGHVNHELTVARQRLASLLTETGKFPDARKVLEDAVRDAGGPPGPGRPPWQSAAAYQQLADVCRKMGDPRAADDAGKMASALMAMPMGMGKGPKDGKDKKDKGPWPGGPKWE